MEERNLPPMTGEFQPRLIQARVKAGEDGIERLTWQLPADFAGDKYGEWLKVEGQDQVDRSIFSVERARGMIHWLEQMHRGGNLSRRSGVSASATNGDGVRTAFRIRREAGWPGATRIRELECIAASHAAAHDHEISKPSPPTPAQTLSNGMSPSRLPRTPPSSRASRSIPA